MAGEWRETIYGEVAADFAEDRLQNLCDPKAGIQTGPFGSQLHQEDYVPVGTPIITVEHLGENRILHDGVPRVSDADRDRLSRYLLRTGDIVFSRVGSVDRRALVRSAEDGWMFSGRCLRVRPDPERIDSGYLSYFFGLPAFKEHIRAIAVGATMPSLNTSLLSDVVIPHPKDIAEQRAIAHILGTLDDKIELNRRMNETLEAMARALFKSWFVDFDPVRAKAEGRDPGLPKSLADLFPDSFVDSELGEIPKGWEVQRVGEQRKRCPPTQVFEHSRDDRYLFLTILLICISAESLCDRRQRRQLSSARVQKQRLTKMLPVGDLLCELRCAQLSQGLHPHVRRGTNVPADQQRSSVSQGYRRIRNSPSFWSMRNPDTIDYTPRAGGSGGSVLSHTSMEQLR